MAVNFPVYKETEVQKLIPYALNSRTHSDEQVLQIASSIKEFGFTNPILIDESLGIIAGHGRLLAAKRLGIGTVPTITLSGLSDAQKKAYVIADNQLALNSGWDVETLKIELEHLKSVDFNIDLLGFDDDFLDDLFPEELTEGLVDEDQCGEPPENPVSKLGDVWILGNHRLMCGDSTNLDSVDILCNGSKCDLVFTDPPYGMSYGGGRAGKVGSTDGTVKKFGVILGDTKTGEELIDLVRDAILSAKLASKDGASFYVCFPWRTYSEFEPAVESAGLTISACIVWDKKSIGLGLSNYRPQHEFIFYCKGDSWHGDKAQSDVWYMSRGATGKYVHPTQKPVELIEKAIQNSSKAGDIVIDVFGGSGSTMIACEKTNRAARLMELDPKYCDVIIKRWQEFTGKDATLDSSGETFNSLTQESDA